MEKFIFISFAFHFSLNNIHFFRSNLSVWLNSDDDFWLVPKINRETFHSLFSRVEGNVNGYKWLNQWSVGRARNYTLHKRGKFSFCVGQTFNESITKKKTLLFENNNFVMERVNCTSCVKWKQTKMYNKISNTMKILLCQFTFLARERNYSSKLNLLAKYAPNGSKLFQLMNAIVFDEMKTQLFNSNNALQYIEQFVGLRFFCSFRCCGTVKLLNSVEFFLMKIDQAAFIVFNFPFNDGNQKRVQIRKPGVTTQCKQYLIMKHNLMQTILLTRESKSIPRSYVHLNSVR